MKILFLTSLLLVSPAFSHMHGYAGQGAGLVAFAWNFAEITAHGLELAGYKPIYKSTCGCCTPPPQGARHSHGTSKIERAYHIIELATHGINMFDVTAKMSDSVSESIEEYISPVLISASAFSFNAAVIFYRLFDAKKQFTLGRTNSRQLAYGFGLWGLIDAAMHMSSIYISLVDNSDSLAS